MPVLLTALRELLWLLASAVVAFGLMGLLVGYQPLLPGHTLEVQLHNTYFILTWWLTLLPMWLVLATLATEARAAWGRFRQRAITVVLISLGSAWLLGLLAVAAGVWASRR